MANKNNKKALGVLVNDIHLDKDNGSLIKDIFRQLISLCREYKTNRIFCGGDVFTNRSGQPLQCLTDWKEILVMLSEEDIEYMKTRRVQLIRVCQVIPKSYSINNHGR